MDDKNKEKPKKRTLSGAFKGYLAGVLSVSAVLLGSGIWINLNKDIVEPYVLDYLNINLDKPERQKPPLETTESVDIIVDSETLESAEVVLEVPEGKCTEDFYEKNKEGGFKCENELTFHHEFKLKDLYGDDWFEQTLDLDWDSVAWYVQTDSESDYLFNLKRIEVYLDGQELKMGEDFRIKVEQNEKELEKFGVLLFKDNSAVQNLDFKKYMETATIDFYFTTILPEDYVHTGSKYGNMLTYADQYLMTDIENNEYLGKEGHALDHLEDYTLLNSEGD